MPEIQPEVVLPGIVLVAVVALVVLRPLLTGAEAERREEAELAELEAAKEAKFGEIRDAELDFRMGKLSEEDWRELDRSLRAEAIEILRRIDRLEGRQADAPLP